MFRFAIDSIFENL